MDDESYSESILAKLDRRKRKQPLSVFAEMKERKKLIKAKIRQRKEEKAINSLETKMRRETATKEAEEALSKQRANEGRDWTVSIALPGSIVDNAQSAELRTYLAGQIARAATVFSVDEVIVFDELKTLTRNEDGEVVNVNQNVRSRNGCILLAKVLQYLECPQYLRKAFFPPQPDLRFAGLLNPLDAAHHLRADAWFEYREGVTRAIKTKRDKGTYVDIGLTKDCLIDKELVSGTRVTVKIDPTSKDLRAYRGVVVPPSEPRLQTGKHWGFKTRLCTCLSEVINKCPYEEGYDITIGTSERGESVDTYSIPKKFKHLLVVFGGLKGLESAVESDDKLNFSDPKDMFSSYLNTCPGQGSGTIRTEEAVLITMAALRPKIATCQAKDAIC